MALMALRRKTVIFLSEDFRWFFFTDLSHNFQEEIILWFEQIRFLMQECHVRKGARRDDS